MKKAVYTLFAVLVSLAVLADVPQSFNYQAVLRDAEGQVMSEQNVKVDISILKGSAEGEPVLIETHNTSTNAFGLINLMVGSVTSLETIEWNDGPYFIKISVNDTEMGTSQLLSVPYSLFSLQSADAFSGNYEDLANLPDLEGLVQVAENPQTGDMLFFNGTNWEKIPFGREGDYLQIFANKIQWLPMGGVSDIDGNIYNTIRIGDLEWLDRNLTTSRYQNGDTIRYIPNNMDAESAYHQEWKEIREGAWSTMPHELLPGIETVEEVIAAYGKYYNFHAIEDPRGICPPGFRVASLDDWMALKNQVVIDGYYPAAAEARAVKSCRAPGSPLGGDCDTNEHPRWNFFGAAFGTDDYGFGWLPAGFRDGNTGMSHSSHVGFIGRYWTSTPSPDGTQGVGGQLLAHIGLFFPNDNVPKELGAPVRCVRE